MFADLFSGGLEWGECQLRPGKTLALTWSFLTPILMGIPAVALMLSNEFMMEGCLIMLLMLIQPCFICRLVLRFSFKRSLLSILFIYGPLALILFTLLWSFSRMAESTPF